MMRSPKRVARGIRSSFELQHTATSYQAVSTELPVPSYVVVDDRTGVLRAVWERVAL